MQRLRKESSAKDDEVINIKPRGLSHEEIIGGKLAQNKTSFTVRRSGKPVALKDSDFIGRSLQLIIYIY